jgi:hypothetical protein
MKQQKRRKENNNLSSFSFQFLPTNTTNGTQKQKENNNLALILFTNSWDSLQQ